MMKSYIAAGLFILMETKPLQSITVDEIVKKAGVNRSTYYRHFSSKEDVIYYFFDSVLNEYIGWSKTQPLTFKEYLTKMFEHYLKFKKQFITAHKNGQSLLFLDVLKKHFYMHTNESSPALEQFKIAFHVGGTFNQFLLWLSRDMADSPETMMRYTLAVLPNEFVPYIFNNK